MAKMRTESVTVGDQSWLGSLHGVDSARTAVLKKSAFTQATHYPDGYLKSGIPLAKAADGTYGPYGAAPLDTLAGFLVTEQLITNDPLIAAPLMDHGRVIVAKLPVAFTAPAAGKDATRIVFA